MGYSTVKELHPNIQFSSYSLTSGKSNTNSPYNSVGSFQKKKKVTKMDSKGRNGIVEEDF